MHAATIAAIIQAGNMGRDQLALDRASYFD
jgi:hypothetical protein